RDGRVVLLIHGATVPGWEFDRLVPYLHAAGLRTLRADLYGHGRSARPRAVYHHALFVRQLGELLDHLGLVRDISLVGHSLGAALAARLLVAQPARFERAVLGAPLVDYMANMPATRLLALPLLGECLVAGYVLPMLRRRRRRNYRVIEDGRFVGYFMEQLREPGFGRALLSMFRAGALGPQHDCYEMLAALPHPVLVLRGRDDAIMSAAQLGELRARLPAANVIELVDTAHAFPLTHPELAAPAIVRFLSGGADDAAQHAC
ncbi:MAG: alpha/beta hydrolase, partial [Gammaproteobacteria bacterium]